MDTFKAEFLKSSHMKGCCAATAGLQGSASSGSPAQPSLHDHTWSAWDEILGKGKESQEDFPSIAIPGAPLCHRELWRTPISEVQRDWAPLLIWGWVHEAHWTEFPGAPFSPNANCSDCNSIQPPWKSRVRARITYCWTQPALGRQKVLPLHFIFS